MEPAKLRRHEERAKYDVDSLQSVFSDTFLSHVSYVDDGLPQCLPMIALFRSEGEGQDPVVYLHGHPSARLMEIVRNQEKDRESHQGSTIDGEPDARFRVCIAATKVDGLVLSSAPNGHTFNYRCGVVHGACSVVKDREVKWDVMRAVTNHIVKGRWDDVNPVASFQVSLVCVIRVEIVGGSVKFRAGVPGIQPRDKEKDGPDHQVQPWTGVVPLYEHLDAPIESGLTDGAEVPKGLQEFIKIRNDAQEEHALSVAK